MRRSVALGAGLLLASGLACARPAPPAPLPAPPPAKEAPMSPAIMPHPDDVRIGETEVARLGAWKVALAKCFEDSREGRKVAVAWLSVVEKGSDAGAKDLALVAGDTLPLGPDTYTVADVTLPTDTAAGSVLLRKR